MKYAKLIFAATLCIIGCTRNSDDIHYTDFVDPFIGTGGHGHVFVGANVPFGMVQLGPTSIPQEWDWCSGYHESDSTVIGFSHTHLSGTGIGDLFDITVMPVIDSLKADGTSSLTYARGSEEDPASGLWSYADRSKEISRPGYYSVPLTRYGITAEMTATTRVGLHRYTFPASETAGIVFDLKNGGCWDRAMDTFIESADPSTGFASAQTTTAIRGYRYSRGWASDQKIYFYAEFSKPLSGLDIIREDVRIWENVTVNLPTFAKAGFQTEDKEQVLLKVALSPVSMEGAFENMQAELPGWDFKEVTAEADRLWNDELGKIKVEAKDTDALKIFYTALYHSMIAPSTFCDVDGAYRGADGKTYADPGHKTLTTFSLWDTYRAAMPLYSIIKESYFIDMIYTMLAINREQGKLPVWHLHGCETNCMVGNPGIPPVADAIVRGFGQFDPDEAFEAMKASALRPDRGQDLRMKYGYIPCDLVNESVAYELEYALADGAIALAAEKLAADNIGSNLQKAEYYKKEADFFRQRSKSYKQIFDPQLGFIRGKDSKGNFRTEYSPFASTHRGDDYCEGNGWQYTWLVPHDFDGLVECFGSKEAFINKLDSLFIVPSVVEGLDASPDISGLIGQYAHGNEPSHHILYFYTMAGQPWKTADRVRQVLSIMYTSKPDGLCGNEDVGQMSAWYILSSLGFYQVEPGSGRYWFGSPLFDKVEIVTREAPWGIVKFKITAKNNSSENRYIQRVTLNGKPYNKGYIDHEQIAWGGELVFHMGPKPAIWY